MREILFRGKRTDNGEWVEGYYMYDDIPPFTNEPRTEIVRGGAHQWGYSMIPYEVVPETVGQYTGLTDKNGKKIFEGDILKGSWETILTIFYDEISSSYRVKTSTGHEREPSYYGIDKWEIIGNIHDNPELLKEVQG